MSELYRVENILERSKFDNIDSRLKKLTNLYIPVVLDVLFHKVKIREGFFLVFVVPKLKNLTIAKNSLTWF